MKIAPARRIKGTVSLPGDKSISHRAAMIAALARGRSTIKNFSTSDDCNSTLSCLAQLGVAVRRSGSEVHIEGVGRMGFKSPSAPLDCGNSGSTMRMLAGLLTGQQFSSVLTGDDSLKQRPMQRIIEPLELMGARILSKGGFPPLHIEGGKRLTPISYDMPIASAQVKTCVLLAGLSAEGLTEVNEPQAGTRDHTERLLQFFGVRVHIYRLSRQQIVTLKGPVNFDGQEVSVPGDFSSAAFLIAAAAILPGSELTIQDVGLNPTRTQFLNVGLEFVSGYSVPTGPDESNEPRGTMYVSRSFTQPSSRIEISGETAAAMIDELPLLAVIGTQLEHGLIIRDAAELRVKETDRLAATTKNLRAMGAEVEEFSDGLAVKKSRLRGAVIESFNDHRIAMAFAIAALLADGESEILGSECVAVSFPEFFKVLESLVVR